MVETYRRTFRIILFSALSLLFSFTAFSADPTKLSGTVVDQQGAAIPNGRVTVHWDSAGLDDVKENIGIRDDKIATTDSTGDFSLDLPPGVYDIFVTAPGFSPHCEKLTLKAQEMHHYEVRLKVSRMITITLD
jgi:Carboxypeptidase regulatory-like domain